MMLYKRGNTWWYDFRFKGRRIARSTRQQNKAVARQIEAAHRTRLAKGEVGIHEPKPVPTFEDFSKSFLSHIKSVHEAKPKTVAYYQTGLTRLKDFDLMKKLPLDQIDKAVIDAYVEKRKGEKKSNGKPFKVASINRHLEVLRRMLRLANEWKIISIVPRIRRLPGEEGRDRVITHAEEIAYLASADEPLRTIATVLVDTGMRPEEAFA